MSYDLLRLSLLFRRFVHATLTLFACERISTPPPPGNLRLARDAWSILRQAHKRVRRYPPRPISIPHEWKDGTPVARSPYLMDGTMAPQSPDLHTSWMEGWHPSRPISILDGWKDGTPVARSPYLMVGRMASPRRPISILDGWKDGTPRPISILDGWKDGTPVARSPYLPHDGRMVLSAKRASTKYGCLGAQFTKWPRRAR